MIDNPDEYFSRVGVINLRFVAMVTVTPEWVIVIPVTYIFSSYSDSMCDISTGVLDIRASVYPCMTFILTR